MSRSPRRHDEQLAVRGAARHEQFGKEVHAYSVAWDADEIAAVATFADKVIFNSISQLERIRTVVAGLPLGLRVNPGVSYSHFDLADPARPHSRLGVTDDADAACRGAAARRG